MSLQRATYFAGLINEYAGVLLCVCIGALVVSCPAMSKGTAQGADTVVGHDFEDRQAKPVSDVEAQTGADAEGSNLMPTARPGNEMPFEPEPLSRFYAALAQTELSGKGKVRVLHYGDSHTAADFLTTSIRRKLQQRFGDGGRGFVLVGRPWPSYRPKDIETTVTGEWTPERILIAEDPAKLDGYYGLSGITTETTDKFARSVFSTVEGRGLGSRLSMMDVFYLKQPGGGSFSVYVDNRLKGTVSTQSDTKRTGFYKIQVEEGAHHFEVRTIGDGEVRMFGAALESDGPGVVYDTLGVNGGFFYTPHRWNREELHKQIKRRDPDLIVTMYGTNETDSRMITPQSYKEKVLRTMERFQVTTGDAACLMIAPPDRRPNVNRPEQLDWIIDVQREVAGELGCAFVVLRDLMGGVGSHELWQQKSPPYAQPDGIHLTVRGYMELGEMVADQILAGYDAYSNRN